MATHAHHPGDTVSGAKLGVYGAIATTLITAVGGIIVAVMNHSGSSVDIRSKESTATTITPTASQVSDRSSADQFVISGTGDVTVSGSAQQDVNRMFILIGPKPSGGYWTGYADVLNKHWKANVATDPPWQNYTIQVFPYNGPSGGTTSPNAFKFTFQGTETTTQSPSPPPQDQIMHCAAQFGPSCLHGPGFGPPSVYQPNQ
jgi:hypothetical protein